MDGMLQDVRYGLRQLRRSPGFSAVAVLTLALGIAVNATMFSLVSAFLLRRPPGRDPGRVAVVSSVNPSPGFLQDAFPVSVPNYLSWRQANHVFSDMAAADEERSVNLASEGPPEVVRSAAVSLNYFGLLGVSPRRGRSFMAGEDRAGRDHVVVLSHDLWQRRFHSDPSVLERTLRLNREDFTVIGVMAPDFRLLGFTPQLWTPLVLGGADEKPVARKVRALRLYGRMKEGVTLDQARAELAALARRAESDFPESEKGWGAAVRSLPDFLVYNFAIRSALLVLMTAVGFVLLIACANVAGLLLTRAVARQREISLRISLGASRGRVIRQLVSEGLLVAVLGGAAGLLLAQGGIRLVRASLAFNEAISAVSLSLDRRVLLFTLALSLVSALLASLAPALKASRTDLQASLKDESRGSSAGRSHARLRAALVGGEIAMALFLLIGTGLLVRGIYVVEHQALGFQVEHLLTAATTLDEARYQDAARKIRFVNEVLARLERLPEVQAAAAASELPATGAASVSVRIEGQPEPAADQRPSALDVVVTRDYLRAAGIPLLRGRSFEETDDGAAPRVVLVNQEFVGRYLGGREPIGTRILVERAGEAEPPRPDWREIAGVVGNVKSYSEDTREDPQVYEPFLQRPVSSFSLMLRTDADPAGAAPDMRDAVAGLDAELPLARVMSMSAQVEAQRGGGPFFTKLLGGFALLALVLASIGIYGLIAYSVGMRTREIGVRMAVGARSSDVLRMILWEGLKTAAAGGAVGLLAALPLPKAFAGLFYSLQFSEPALYVLVPAVILLVAFLATYLPARRAAKLNPVVALRYE
jgi:predicted permease